MIMVTISHAQVTQGTVFSKTEDGVGNKITSTVVGPARGLDVNVIATTGGGSTYLDADGIANQTASAVHGQTYLYDPVGLNWNRARGDTTNGMWVNCKTGCSASALTTVADAGNSTLVTLAGGGNFTGAAFDLTNYASWSVSVFSDKASSANGFTIEWSEDNVNWGAADVTTYVSAQTNMASFGHKARYVRINYTNGGVGQVTFRVYAWAHPFVRQTRKFVGNALEDTDTAQIVISSLQGHTTAGGGAWVPVKVNPSGALTADVTQATSPWVVSGTVAGNKTNNNAAPGATNVGTLPCIATAAAPSNTEGNQTGCSQNLLGAQRVIEQNFVATANNDGSCASGAASFTAIASNASRTWLAVWASPANTDDVYLKLGATATAADARFAPGQPLNFTSGRIYTGIIDAFPASGTQSVCVLELN
jgi:hypothetical protein